jgi:hypothetical protein
MPLIVLSVQLMDTEINHPDYGKLHDKMKDVGFLQTVEVAGRTINFNHAEYGRVTDETDGLTARQYADRATKAVSSLNYRNRVNVSIVRLLSDFESLGPVPREHPHT